MSSDNGLNGGADERSIKILTAFRNIKGVYSLNAS